MSTPRFLTLPTGVSRVTIETSRGPFAALEALPGSGVSERCPALLVPGFTGSKEDFLAVLQPLAASGRRVVAIDMRGQYESDGPGDPSEYDCPSLGEDVTALLDVLGTDPVHLVGHSFGGLVTRESVLDDLIRPASYTLMGSGPAAISGPTGTRAAALRDALPEMGMQAIWEISMEPELTARGVPLDIVDFLKRRMLGTSEASLIGMAGQLLTAPDRTDELAKHCADTGLRTLVLYGEDDDAWPPETQAAMAERLDADRVVIPSAAHSPAVEAPETTASALIDFWNQAERTLG
ncbi:hydrolase [Actinomadura sp. CNU-125]|uniref:alpha/beta fold hydrolase n=1 Tax=Actinomadura sp. CNU-125 TaxID=1904961 RepID=UPI000960612F|nr:alpha/beta hydrolase [Actinomadura sp. CNU-125]OLT37373.1 hydrolase [Actinomadura sp. CNU-125]